MSGGQTALLIGSTGLVGGHLLELLGQDTYYKTITVFTRKEIKSEYQNLQILISDFDNLELELEDVKVDHVFCCLGSTMKKAGSRERFREIDFGYPLRIAHATLENGASHFSLVSAMGANMNSSFYYNRVKGEVENGIAEIGFKSFYAFRPALILGDRKESRLIEEIGKNITSVISFSMVGPFLKYKPAHALQIAKAMLHHAKNNKQGNHIILNKEMIKY